MGCDGWARRARRWTGIGGHNQTRDMRLDTTKNRTDIQTQLLLGQPGWCLQVLRSYPRRVSPCSFFVPPSLVDVEEGGTVDEVMRGWESSWPRPVSDIHISSCLHDEHHYE
jgi:hypothetical protein